MIVTSLTREVVYFFVPEETYTNMQKKLCMAVQVLISFMIFSIPYDVLEYGAK